MKAKRKKARPHQRKGLARQPLSKDSYPAAQLTSFLAEQIKSLRGDMSQKEFGKLLGKPQSVISRLEDPHYGKVTVQTLLDVAAKLDVMLTVQFVSRGAYQRLMEFLSSDPLLLRDESGKELD